jgi:hypothetical protein
MTIHSLTLPSPPQGAAEQFRQSIHRLKLLRKDPTTEQQQEPTGGYTVSLQDSYKKNVLLSSTSSFSLL